MKTYARLGLAATAAGIGFLIFQFAGTAGAVRDGIEKPALEPSGSTSGVSRGERAVDDGPAREPSQREPAQATAVTVSQPVLSFRGFLETHIQSLPWDTDDSVQMGSSQSPAHLTQSKHFNPEGKTLSAEAEKQLAAVLRDFDARREQQLKQEGVLSKAAFVRAVQAGLFEVAEFGPAPAWSDPDAMQAYTKAQQARSKKLLEDLTARLGEPLVDWAYTSISSSEPDGVPRQTIVYFMQRDAPEVFAARSAMDDLQRERDQALRDFFRRM